MLNIWDRIWVETQIFHFYSKQFALFYLTSVVHTDAKEKLIDRWIVTKIFLLLLLLPFSAINFINISAIFYSNL